MQVLQKMASVTRLKLSAVRTCCEDYDNTGNKAMKIETIRPK